MIRSGRLWAALNCHDGRNPDVVAKHVARIFAKRRRLGRRIRVLLVQEAGHYFDAIDALPGLRVAVRTECGTGIIVRDNAVVRHAQAVPMDTTRWTFRGHSKPNREGAFAIIGGISTLVGHGVPNPGLGDNGALARDRAYNEGMTAIVEFIDSQPLDDTPLVIEADWNKPAHATGPGTPAWVADQIGAQLVPGGHFDYTLSRDCQVTGVRQLDEGDSDHPLLIFTVHPHRKATP